MVFIHPIKRSSTFKTFSKHENVLTTQDNRFALQKRKKPNQPGLHDFRIILLGNPYYEIAYSNDLNQLKEREWRYLCEELPNRIPESKREKDLIAWFLAHFTCLAMELGNDKITPDEDSDNETDMSGKLSLQSNQTDNNIANIPSCAGVMHHEPLPLDKPYFSASTPSGQVGAGFSPPPQSRHSNQDTKLYPSTTFPLRGIGPLIICMVLFNAPMILVRELKNETYFSLLMTICNIIIFSVISLGFPYRLGISRMVSATHFDSQQHKQSQQQNKNSTTNSTTSTTSSDQSTTTQETTTDVLDGMPVKPGGATKCSSKGITPGHTLQQSTPGQVAVNTYSDPQGQSWNLRCGPDYAYNKAKAPGGPSLFDLVGLDVFLSNQKIQHVARHINFEPLYTLPKTPYVSLDSEIDINYQNVLKSQQEKPLDYIIAAQQRTQQEIASNIQLPASPIYDPSPDPNGKVLPKGDLLPGFHFGSIEKPFLFFITMQIPTYAPSYMGGSTDGEGMNLVWYCRATPETQRDLLRPDPVNPAVGLLKRYLIANPSDADYQALMDRFKNIPRLVNTEEFDFGWSVNKLVKQYNAKPFLTRPQGVLHRGPGYANFDLDIHQFCYMAKKVLHSFIPKVASVVLDWTFCVEGSTDAELPESTIAQFRVFKIQAQSFPSWEETVKELQKAKSDPNYDATHSTGLNGGVTVSPSSPNVPTTGKDKVQPLLSPKSTKK